MYVGVWRGLASYEGLLGWDTNQRPNRETIPRPQHCTSLHGFSDPSTSIVNLISITL